MVLCVKIGKIFRQFSIKNADTSEQKLKFLKNFNSLSQIELRATSDEKRLYFRIKRAGSSNYRGSVFYSLNLPEFIPGCTYTALLPGSVCLLAFEFTLDVSSLVFLSGAGGCFFTLWQKAANYLRAHKAQPAQKAQTINQCRSRRFASGEIRRRMAETMNHEP